MRRMSAAFVGLAIALIAPRLAEAMECASNIQPIPGSSSLAYQDRGDRCEGLYAQPVSTTGLRIVGFLSRPSAFQDNDLGTYVFSGGGGTRNITVTTTRPRQYYRMDTSVDTGAFFFSLDIIRHPELGIRPEELVAVICKAGCNGLRPELIPATIAAAEEPATGSYLILQATHELRRLRLTVSDLSSGDVLFDRQLLDGNRWEAWRPAEFPLEIYLAGSRKLLFTAIAEGSSNTQIDTISAILSRE